MTINISFILLVAGIFFMLPLLFYVLAKISIESFRSLRATNVTVYSALIGITTLFMYVISAIPEPQSGALTKDTIITITFGG